MTATQLPLPDPEDWLNSNAHWSNDSRTNSNQRKWVGDKHEQRVRKEFERRGWEVNNWGQGTLGPVAIAALKGEPNGMRWAPDFFVARGNSTAFVDAKASMPFSGIRDSYFVESSAVEAHLKLFADLGASTFYVFDDLKVINAIDAKRYGTPRKGSRRGSGTPVRSIPVKACWPLDRLFGGTGQEVEPLREAG